MGSSSGNRPAPKKLHIEQLHPWDVTPKEARAIQQSLRETVVLRDEVGPVHHVAGVDAGYDKLSNTTRVAAVVLAFPSLEVVEQAIAQTATTFPYVPGLLSFREIPAACRVLAKLEVCPDLILCDGHGYAHPRRFGLACHLGVLTNVPCIGVGKTRLIGTHPDVPDKRGHWVALSHGDETLGAVLRTRIGVKPIFVSVGHRVTLDTAVKFTMACTTRFRLPETTRHADRLASKRGRS